MPFFGYFLPFFDQKSTKNAIFSKKIKKNSFRETRGKSPEKTVSEKTGKIFTLKKWDENNIQNFTIYLFYLLVKSGKEIFCFPLFSVEKSALNSP